MNVTDTGGLTTTKAGIAVNRPATDTLAAAETGNGSAAAGPEVAADGALVNRVAQGDGQAFEMLVRRHTDRHLAFAERLLGNRQDAEDMIQDAFAKVWLHAERFDPSRASFRTWFYRIVYNRCVDLMRRRRDQPLPEHYDAADDTPSPSEQLAESRRAKRIQLAVSALPVRQKAAVTLCYFEGLSNREAADILGLHIKALESLLTRGRRQLATQLEPEMTELGG